MPFSRRILVASLGLAVPTLTQISYAASFQILEQSPAFLGQAFAGTASDTKDATSVFFNPASLTEFDSSRISLGANAIFTQSEFTSTNSNTNGTNGKTDETGYVPNIYWVQPVSERLTFGLGINAPYGLASEYDNDWVGRYLATHSELEVVNLNAVFAFALNEQWSIGVGLDYQRTDVTLRSQIDSTLGVNPQPSTDSSATIQGDDDDLVADVSLYFKPGERTRLGLIWRQGGEFDLQGDARFSLNAICSPGAGFPTGAPPAPTTGSICAATLSGLAGDAKAHLELPDTLTLSTSHRFSDYWWIHADIAWTNWDSIDTVDVVNSGNNALINRLELKYENSMRYALGFSYQSDCPWSWRFGVAYDEAPQTNPIHVNPRIPDENRLWIAGGFNYRFSDGFSVDLGYAHIKVDDTRINNTNPQTGHRVVGTFDSSVDVVGLQANWIF
jgi:long-chain fatty acid transport protein